MNIKHLALLLPVLILVGCSKSSASTTTETLSCTELTAAYAATSEASGSDPTNKELCEDNVEALMALIDAECEGFTAEVYDESVMTALCDMLTALTGG